MENALEIWFPGLKNTEYDITSPKTDDYNCIAHAANDDENFWWPAPGHYWPSGMPLGDNIENFTKAFCEVLGYEVCSDGELEPGYLKLAIYAIGNDTKHMARQLSDGSWTSKLGVERDITHTLAAVEGQH